MPFTDFPIPTVPLSEVTDSEFRYGSIFCDADKLQHVNHGRFFRANENYSHCFWEAWVKPSSLQSSAGYIVSDNHGGNHNILWGVSPTTATHCEVTGNFYDGTTLTSFTQSEQIPMNHWTHLAVGWDGTYIRCWTNGIVTHYQAYAPAQRMQPGGNDQTLHIGGSDHNNFYGHIAQVRAFEGYGRGRHTVDFTPDMIFRGLTASSGDTNDLASFCVSYQTPARVYLDTGRFHGVSHHGVPQAVQSVTAGLAYIDPDLGLPTFTTDDITLGTYIPTAPATPSGAVIWDSFSRPNNGTNNPDSYITGVFSLGTVEVGGVDWTELSGATSTGGCGVLNGRAYIFNASAPKAVQTSIQNMDVRVNRLPTTLHSTALYLRYKDGSDYYLVEANETSITVTKRESGVSTTVGYSPVAGWTTLRAVANGTTMTIYTGTGTEGTFTSAGSFTCTNVTGATKAGITLTAIGGVTYYDNFLVKAA